VPLTPLARRYDHMLLDLDGCVWVGDEPTPRAAEAVDALRAAGTGIAFVTHDARHSTEEFVRKLWRLGLRASVEEVVTVGGALQHVLNERHPTASAYVIGAPAVHRHVADAGLRVVNGTTFDTRADVVVVAGHEDLVFDELRVATQALLRGAAFWGASRDRTYPMPDGPWPGGAAFLAALEAATERTAETVGKPAPQLFWTALDRLGVAAPVAADEPPGPLGAAGSQAPPRTTPSRTLVVGDRLDADVAGAHAAGLDGALVLSGATSAAEAAAWSRPSPVAVGATLAELVLGPA
jgi:HAD superfamily hydrolase (TIGR01450 family)